MPRIRPMLSCLMLAMLLLPLQSPPAAVAQDAADRVQREWKGDLGEMLEQRRPIRVLVVYNRTNFFIEEGVVRGLEADMMRAWEEWLGKRHAKELVRLVFVPVTFADLVPALLDGRGDVIAAGLTVTAERSKEVAFAAPYRTGVTAVAVGGPRSRALKTADELSGRKVSVVEGTSYAEHLADLSGALKRKGLAPVKIVKADPVLATEDLLEMASKGMIEYTAADVFMAEAWTKAFPKLRLFPDAVIHADGRLAWGVRPDCPELKASLSEFAATVRQGTLLGNMFFKRYYVNEDFVANPTDSGEIGKLRPLAELFRKYGREYGFDWLKIAAMAYQESRFDMNRKSSAGAVGIMQIKPSTAAEMGVKDISTPDGNVHAGVAYLRYLCDRYFSDVDEDAKMDFALAAYNAGPARITQVRKKAREMGLDPDRWFGNAEWAAFALIGRETTAYVAHVQMYYAAYKASEDILLKRRDAM
ncbi:transglycosylase SLT domain-containing protein [Pseudodesulfovibrio indicus]|uniref:Membrane-bound lytic murein transglycosylase MltF n=2 Tax=Pseudodesulfovibrio indicus TaxID=1716143 RepID=A0AA94PS37_9BACT|nr:transporter substrate-binding domain-containing protein [Pseudodesulfovibrio indicus]TDT86984.1 membrane-bound lytic murein transglycosylase MltF [Pseudodesulfovibrio indicus]